MIKLFTDAASKGNPGPSGAGLMIIGPNIYQQLSLPLPVLSNHEAELAAICAGLDYLLENNWQDETIFLYTDSRIATKIIEDNYTNNIKFKPYLSYLQSIWGEFRLIIVKWVPKKENQGADRLARQGLQKALKK